MPQPTYFFRPQMLFLLFSSEGLGHKNMFRYLLNGGFPEPDNKAILWGVGKTAVSISRTRTAYIGFCTSILGTFPKCLVIRKGVDLPTKAPKHICWVVDGTHSSHIHHLDPYET